MANEVSPYYLFYHCVHGLNLTFKFDLPTFSFPKFGHTCYYSQFSWTYLICLKIELLGFELEHSNVIKFECLWE